jgi:hypothetical protein
MGGEDPVRAGRRPPLTRRLLSAVVLLSLLAGCGTAKLYQGKRLPRKQVAVLAWSSRGPQILEIDGMPVSPGLYRFALLPGPHTVKLLIWVSHLDRIAMAGEHEFPFEAEAGAKYEARGEVHESGSVTGWVVNAKTGATAGGINPIRGDKY